MSGPNEELPLVLTESREDQCGACWYENRVNVVDFVLDFTLVLDQESRCGGSRVGFKLHGDLFGSNTSSSSGSTASRQPTPTIGDALDDNDHHKLSCDDDRDRRHEVDEWALYFETSEYSEGGLDVELADSRADDDRHDYLIAGTTPSISAAPTTPFSAAHHPTGPGTWNVHLSYKQSDGRMLVQWARVDSAVKPRSKWFVTDISASLDCHARWLAHPEKPVCECMAGVGFVGSTEDWCYERQTVTAFSYIDRSVSSSSSCGAAAQEAIARASMSHAPQASGKAQASRQPASVTPKRE